MPQEKDVTLIPSWNKFIVTDSLVNKVTYSVKVTLSSAIPCFIEDILTEE